MARGAFGVGRFISRADAGEFFVGLHVHNLELFGMRAGIRPEGQLAEETRKFADYAAANSGESFNGMSFSAATGSSAYARPSRPANSTSNALPS
jgi:hypothetical protein